MKAGVQAISTTTYRSFEGASKGGGGEGEGGGGRRVEGSKGFEGGFEGGLRRGASKGRFEGGLRKGASKGGLRRGASKGGFEGGFEAPPKTLRSPPSRPLPRPFRKGGLRRPFEAPLPEGSQTLLEVAPGRIPAFST